MGGRLLLCVFALILSSIGVALVRRWAERRQVLVVPSAISAHTRPTPAGGGLAIATVTLAGVVAWSLWTNGSISTALLAYVVAAALIAGVSWIDDLINLSYKPRMAVHILVAVIAVWFIGPWDTHGIVWLNALSLGWIGTPLTILWIVGLINAFNFLDGIDGIAGSTAMIAGLSWALLGTFIGHPLVVVIGLLLAATSLGFLGHNWPPARIFMGDVGSTFLGYTFAVLPLFASHVDVNLFLAGPLMLWPCIFDSLFTVIVRLSRRENVFAGHRSFLFHRLVISGLSHRTVTLLYSILGVIGTLLASAWTLDSVMGATVVIMFLPLLCYALWVHVVRQETRGTPGFRELSKTVREASASMIGATNQTSG